MKRSLLDILEGSYPFLTLVIAFLSMVLAGKYVEEATLSQAWGYAARETLACIFFLTLYVLERADRRRAP